MWLKLDGTGPAFRQIYRALRTSIVSGEFERHIRRARKRYAERRAVLLEALAKRLGDRVQVCGADAGLHVVGYGSVTPADIRAGLAKLASVLE